MNAINNFVDHNDDYVLITGGAGFIGTNLADRLLVNKERVVILDNLSRNGVDQNYEWLLSKYKNKVNLITADVA